MIGKPWWDIKSSCSLVSLMVIGLHPHVSSMDCHISLDTYCAQPNLRVGSDFKIGLKETAEDLDPRHPPGNKLCYKDPVDISKKYVLTEEDRKKILEISINQSKMKNQITEFETSSLNTSSRISIFYQTHMPNFKDISDQLYDRKKLEILTSQRALLRAENVVLNSQAVDEIFLKVIEDLFSCFRQCEEGVRWNDSSLYHEDSRLKINLLSDIIIDLFLDLKKLQLITPETLSEFQRKDQGKLFSSLIMAKYLQDDVFGVYLNFDIRLSIAEDHNLKGNFKEVFQALDGEILDHVELQLIKHQILHNNSNDISPKFHELLEGYLTKASPFNNNSLFQIRNLLENIIDYVSIPAVDLKLPEQKNILITCKALHGMTRIICRKFPEVISNDFKQSLKFQQLQVFREAIGVISNFNHHVYTISRCFPLKITRWQRNFDNRLNHHATHTKELIDKNYLTDSNKHRIASNCGPNKEDEDYTLDSETKMELRRSKEFKEFEKYLLRDWTSGFVPDTMRRFEDQYFRYLIQINKLKEKEDRKKHNFSNSMERLVSLGLDFESFKQNELSFLPQLDDPV